MLSLTLGESGAGFASSFDNPVVEVFDPAGVSGGLFSPGQRELTLATSGTYTIEVRANDFQSTGGYGLSVQCLVPPGANAIPLDCGSSVTGAIDAVGKAVLYRFTGTAGQVLSLTLGESGAGFASSFDYPVVEIFSPTGMSVVSFGPGQQRPTLPAESGTYTIEVRANDFQSIGGYGLSLQCLTLAGAEYRGWQWPYRRS